MFLREEVEEEDTIDFENFHASILHRQGVFCRFQELESFLRCGEIHAVEDLLLALIVIFIPSVLLSPHSLERRWASPRDRYHVNSFSQLSVVIWMCLKQLLTL